VPGAAGRRRQRVGDGRSRSNTLIVRPANPARLASVRALIDKLDRPGRAARPADNVVYLKNADATKLAQVLRAAFPGGAGGGGGGSFGRRQRRHGHPARPQGTAGRRRHPPATAPVSASRRAVHRRLHPGRPGHQLADHHRRRAAVPPAAQRDRPARLAGVRRSTSNR
jgi:general secretion pathway protein D